MESDPLLNDLTSLLHSIKFDQVHVLDCSLRCVKIYVDDSSTTERGEGTKVSFFHPVELALHLCRKFNLLYNKNTTLISSDDRFDAMQLLIAQENKSKMGQFVCSQEQLSSLEHAVSNIGTDDSNASTHQRDIIQKYELYLKDWNVIDEKRLYELIKNHLPASCSTLTGACLVVQRESKTAMQREFVELFSKYAEKLFLLEKNSDNQGTWKLEEVRDDTFYAEIYTEGNNAGQILTDTEQYIQQIVLSFLHLLVNTRNEMSLTKAITGTGTSVTHEIFTALRKEAQTSGMPMYQTALSFSRRISMGLGGKGYAPSKDCLLMPFTSEITEFVGLMHKLHSIVEDNPDPMTALKKILNSLRKHLSRGIGQSVRNILDNTASRLLQDATCCFKGISSSQPSSSGRSVCGVGSLKLVQHLVERYAVIFTERNSTVNVLSCSSPSRKLSLSSMLSKYESPVTNENCGVENLTKVSTEVVAREQSVTVQFCSSRSWALEDQLPTNDRETGELTTPVKSTAVKPRRVLADCSNKQQKIPIEKQTRMKVDETEKSKDKTAKQPRKKAKPQISGQAKLTNFFKMQ